MKTTIKTVQVHFECSCGYNDVYQEQKLISWKDLSKIGIKRRKDMKTKEPFLFQYVKTDTCSGEHYD